MSEFVGIKEDWKGNGLTRKEMIERIDELNLMNTTSLWCVLQPYELNFMQEPDMNNTILENIDIVKKLNQADVEFVVASNKLWIPGETITISFDNTGSQFENLVKNTLMTYLQPYISMKLKFVSSNGKVHVKFQNDSTMGGSSAIGKQKGTQNVQLSVHNLTTIDLEFNWARYTILHEFGHVLGMYHEWDREMCKKAGITCTDVDNYSVMNYPSNSSSGAEGAVRNPFTMDVYSDKDKEWLVKVYQGNGEVPVQSTDTEYSLFLPIAIISMVIITVLIFLKSYKRFT